MPSLPCLSTVIDAAEWDVLARFALSLAPHETDRTIGGVRLHTRRGERLWEIGPEWLTVRVEATGPILAGPDPVSVWLPTRLVAVAAGLARADGLVELTLRGASARVSSQSGSATFDVAGPVPEVTSRAPGRVRATAQTSGDHLRFLMDAARGIPTGVELGESRGPLFWLGITDGGVGLDVDWSAFGACASSFRLHAVTDGQARVTVISFHLAAIIDALHPDEDVTVTITDGPVLVSGQRWEATLVEVDIWRQVYAPDDTLVPWPVRPEGEGWMIDVDGTPVTVTLVEGSPPRHQLTVRLVEGIADSPDLLGELNDLTATGVRVWWHDDTVLAGIEMRADRPSDLPYVLHTLLRRTADLGVLLAARHG